jgi:dCTP deaminase
VILTADKILEEKEKKKIIIEPFYKECLNPNSYNFHLDSTLLVYINSIIDTKKEQPTQEIQISNQGFVMQPGELYLGSTEEVMGSDYYAPFIFGRSSIARLGIFVQITAPLGDIGFIGKWTLQITPVRSVKVYPGLRIGQIFFLKPLGKITLYNGKYQNSLGPRKSEVFRDF